MVGFMPALDGIVAIGIEKLVKMAKARGEILLQQVSEARLLFRNAHTGRMRARISCTS